MERLKLGEWWYPTGFSAWGPEEADACERVMASGRFTYGREVEAFEEELAAFHGRKYACMCNSGSSANWLAVAALFHLEENPLQRDDLALAPGIAWATSYNPLMQHGMRLRVADVDATWNVPCGGIREKPRLVVTCPVLGNPCDYIGYQKALSSRDAYWIDDACESAGAWIGPLGEQRYCGSFGIMSTMSFFMSHQIAAIEGGAVLTDSEECYRWCRILRNHGWTRDTDQPEDFAHEYNFVAAGMNLRPVEMHAAIAREQLKKLEVHSRYRQANWNNFETACTGLPIQVPPKLRNAVRSPFGFNFIVESKDVRAKLVAAFRGASIDCRLPTGGSFLQHPYSAPFRDGQHTPVADRIHNTGIFLGIAPHEMNDKIERAVRVMKETL